MMQILRRVAITQRATIWLFFAAFFCFASTASAQSKSACKLELHGTITDSINHEHLIGATVLIFELNKSTSVAADGHFHFYNLCPAKYTLQFSMAGYEQFTTTYNLLKNSELDIHLHEGTLQFKVVDISASQYKPSNTASENTVSETDRNRTAGQPLGDILKTIPGVFAFQTGPTIAKPMIRGMHSNRVLIVNNGVRLEGQQWGSEHAPEIDPFAAQKISVIKGGASLRYGADALGGSIVLEPAPLPHSPGIEGFVQTNAATNGRTGAVSVQLEGNHSFLPKLGWRIQTSAKQGGNLQTAKYYLNNTGVQEQNLSAALGWKEKHGAINLYYSTYNNKIGIFSGAHIGNLADLERAFNRPDTTFNTGFSYQINRPYQLIGHQLLKAETHWNFHDLGKFTLIASYQNDSRKEYDLHKPKGGRSTGPELEFKLNSFQYEALFEHKPLTRWRGQAGIQYATQSNIALGRILIPNFRLYTGAIFISERYFTEKWEFDAGIRADYRWQRSYAYESDTLVSPIYSYQSVSGTIGAIRELPKGFKAKANFNSGWRAPGINELFSDGVHHGSASYEEGNRNLQPERSYSSSITIERSTGRLYGEVGVYANYIDNFMYLQPQYPESRLTIRGAFPYFKYKQANVLFRGIDGQVSYELTQRLQFTAKGSIVRTWNYSENDYLILTPADRITLSSLYKLIDKEQLHLSVRGEIEQVWQQTRAPKNQDYTAPPKGYYLINAGIESTFKYLNRNIYIGLQARNLFNVVYRDYLNRFRYFAYDLGRNVSIQIKIPLFNSNPKQ